MYRLLICCLFLSSLGYPVRDARRNIGPVQMDTTGTLSVNGYTRNFVYAVSAYAAPAGGRPLVIHLHGDSGNMGLSAARATG